MLAGAGLAGDGQGASALTEKCVGARGREGARRERPRIGTRGDGMPSPESRNGSMNASLKNKLENVGEEWRKDYGAMRVAGCHFRLISQTPCSEPQHPAPPHPVSAPAGAPLSLGLCCWPVSFPPPALTPLPDTDSDSDWRPSACLIIYLGCMRHNIY